MTNTIAFDRLVRECMSLTGRSRAEAERAVRRRYPQFAPAPALSGSAPGETAERELERRARELAASERISFAVAYTRILNGDPDLYVRYLKQKQAEIEAASRRA